MQEKRCMSLKMLLHIFKLIFFQNFKIIEKNILKLKSKCIKTHIISSLNMLLLQKKRRLVIILLTWL